MMLMVVVVVHNYCDYSGSYDRNSHDDDGGHGNNRFEIFNFLFDKSYRDFMIK